MSTASRRAIYGKLAGDTTLNNLLGTPATNYTKSIYYQEAPAGAAYPLVIFSKQSGYPTETFGVPSVMDTDTWLVKAVDRSPSADAAESIQARIATLLNDSALSISGASTLYLRRQSDQEYLEVTDGVRYQHAGMLFRFVFA
jgi:hypothetical protein